MKRVSIFSIYFLLALICRSTVPLPLMWEVKLYGALTWALTRKQRTENGILIYTRRGGCALPGHFPCLRIIALER